jgi:dTDP-4-amino-4,6-dideoxy-D-galactose acyltransferase
LGDTTLLEWDSAFFGFPVARVLPPRLDAARLAEILDELRRQGVRLAYWAADAGCARSRAAGEAAGGLLADRKVTYRLDLADAAEASEKPPAVLPFDAERPSGELEDLAIASGAYSRFKVDPRIPAGKFEDLFREWMRRSVSGALADAVLVIREPDGRIAGMVTALAREGLGEIGLLAVVPDFRGRGYGRALVEGAGAFCRKRGLDAVRVVTQEGNAPACRLYERAGYAVERRENVFHFWLA